jgi:RNA polymerase sigma factor (sigma-70 family)
MHRPPISNPGGAVTTADSGDGPRLAAWVASTSIAGTCEARWDRPLRTEDDYEQFFLKERARVLAFVHDQAPGWDDATVQDVAQEAWAALYNHLGKIDNAPAYLYRTVRNKITDVRRHRARITPEHDMNTVIDAAGETADDPADIVTAREEALAALVHVRREAQEVLEALWGLPERQRVAYRLRVVQDMSSVEIAEVLGCTPAAVDTLVSRARSKLIERFARDRLTRFEAGARRWPS